MYRKRYKSGNRMFIVDTTKTIKDNYWPVTDEETGVKFKLPFHVILSKKYLFSWDRYQEERDDAKLKIVLEDELIRLQAMSPSFNQKQGIKHMKKFLKELE